MKKALVYLIAIVFAGSIMVSCNDDTNEDYTTYWYSFATLIQDDSPLGFYFNLDSGGKLEPTNSVNVSDFEDTCRVVVTYSIVSEEGEDTNKVVEGNITQIREILTKDIIQLTEENIDSIGNDLIITGERNIWPSENHLNLIIFYYGYNKVHYVNLAKPIGDQFDEDGNQILELRHNANGDYESYYYQSEIAFDMRSLQEPGMDSINYVLRAIEGDTSDFSYVGTFHFNEPKPAERKIPSADYSIFEMVE